jgi:hypothetical protein
MAYLQMSELQESPPLLPGAANTKTAQILQGAYMDTHITAVGALSIGLSVLGILVGAFVFVLLASIGFVAHDEDATSVLAIIGFAVGVFLFILSIPGIIGGIGLLKRKEWARILVLVTSALHLLNFPIGTVIGAYSIWVLVQQDTIRIFNPIIPVPPAQS